MRILLVEDEQKTGDYLKQGLSEAGYITDWVTDGLSGKHQALSEEYDLIILDVMLPKLDGWNIIYDIHNRLFHYSHWYKRLYYQIGRK